MSDAAEQSGARPYRGVDAVQRLAARRNRLLAAGLDLLGCDGQDISELTVRGVCGVAGLSARYFYESFSDKDEFVGAVYDWVVADLVTTTQAAVAAVPKPEQPRAAMANVVQTISGDPRVGRLLFSTKLSNAVVIRKRVESGTLLAMLSGHYAIDTLRAPANEHVKAGSHFAVGGVGQILSVWLTGNLDLQPEDLVDHLASLLDVLTEPSLYRVTASTAAATAAGRDPATTADT